jgi:hypothetical protein
MAANERGRKGRAERGGDARDAAEGKGVLCVERPPLFRAERILYTGVMVKTLEQAIAELERLPAEDQEQIGRTLLSHVEKLRALRAEIDKGIRSLDAGQGRESSIDDFIRQKNR